MVATRAFVCCALLSAAGVEVSGQEAKRPLEFGSAISVVSLPIFVTDGAGRAVSGLQASEVEITDDGKPVAIVGFRQIDASDPLPDELAQESPAARRQYLLLFDLSFTSASGLVRARQAAHDFVDSGLEPRDLAAVATLSANHGVQLLVGFTSDRNQLKRALRTLGLTQLDRKADPLGLVYDLTEIGSAFADEVTGDQGRRGDANLDDTVRQIQLRFQQAQKADYLQRTRGFLQGMADLARAIDALQGRKQVILLSAGFDATPLIGPSAQENFQSSEAITRGRFWEVRSEDRFGDSSLRFEMERALRSFSMSDSVIHAVDVAGLTARGDARFQAKEPASGSGQESLARIASLSGGHFYKSTNDVGEIFSDILELSRHYYLAAFEPRALKGPGAFHKLRVRVKGKGHRVSHRSGYFEREPYAERTPLARQFEAAELVAKGITGGEIGLKAMAVPYRDGSGRLTLPVVLEVDGTSLVKGSAERLGLEIYGYALDEQGAVMDFLALASNLDLAQVGASLRGRGLQYHGVFTLRPGRYTLRFLVRDSENGRTGTQWLDVSVPSFEGAGVMLFPPLFMDDPEGWVVLRAGSLSSAASASPFRVAEVDFIPRTRPRVENGRPASVCLLAFDGGARYDPGASFEIRPQLLAGDGTPVSVGGFRLDRSLAESDGFRRFVLSFTPTAVPPGEYTLRVRLRDPASGRVSEAFQAVTFE